VKINSLKFDGSNKSYHVNERFLAVLLLVPECAKFPRSFLPIRVPRGWQFDEPTSANRKLFEGHPSRNCLN
jgi:hypothetical protein